MPELVRSIANRLREFVGNRRRAPRYRVRVPAAIAPLDPKALADDAAAPPSQMPSLAGHTFDISATGLGLVVPSVRIGDRYLTGAGHRLHVTLEFPTGPVTLLAVPVRYEQLDKQGPDKGFLIGARITSINDADRARLHEYLKRSE